jgi:hypothetical protein
MADQPEVVAEGALGPMTSGTEPVAGRPSGNGPAGGPPDFDISVAHSARVHNYWLGGQDNYPADRAAGDAVIAAYPGIVSSVRANRAFLGRMVRFLAAAPETILEQAAQTLDFSRPVAVMLFAILHLIGGQDDPYQIVSRLMAATAPGSYLALSQVASDIEPERMAEAAKRYNRLAHEKQHHRSHAEVTRFFDGLELIGPGVVAVQHWRPGSGIEAAARSAMWGGAGRKP